MAIPKAKLVSELREGRNKAGLVRVTKEVWVKRKHKDRAKKALCDAVDSLLREIDAT